MAGMDRLQSLAAKSSGIGGKPSLPHTRALVVQHVCRDLVWRGANFGLGSPKQEAGPLDELRFKPVDGSRVRQLRHIVTVRTLSWTGPTKSKHASRLSVFISNEEMLVLSTPNPSQFW